MKLLHTFLSFGRAFLGAVLLMMALLWGTMSAAHAAATVTVLDSGIDGGTATQSSLTTTTTNTFMGGGFTLGSAAGTANITINGVTLYVRNNTTTNYTSSQATVYFWGTVNTGTVNTTTPAFSNSGSITTPLATRTFNTGALNANTTNKFAFPTLATPVVLATQTVGITVAWKGSTDGTTFASANGLTNIIRYGAAMPTGTSLFNGYYRNANNEVNGNFTNTLKSLGTTFNNQAIAIDLTALATEPTVTTTAAATNVTSTTATLKGTVNPRGIATTAQFQYGTSTTYDKTATVTLSPTNGTTAQSVSADVTGLLPHTLYHFRLSATNNGGTSNGADATFTTANTPPTVTSVSITPSAPKTKDTLTATYQASDADGDTLTPSYVWKNGTTVLTTETGPTLALGTAGNGDRGDKITCTVTVKDTSNATGSATSPEATVINSAPTLTTASITPGAPTTTSVLTATSDASDDDGDTLSYTYQWTKNTTPLSEMSNHLDLGTAGNGDDGDSITVTVTASDAFGGSAGPVTSAPVNVGNFAPSVDSITPVNPTDTVGTSRAFSLTVSDANGASDISTVWFVANTVLDWSNGASLVYVKASNELYLRANNTFSGPITPGSGTLSNDAVIIDGASVLVTTAGNSLTLAFTLQTKSGMVGNNIVWGRAEDAAGTTDTTALPGEFGNVRKGNWVVNSTSGTQQAPSATITPGASGTTTNATVGTPLTLTLDLTDPNGAADLQSGYILINNSPGELSWMSSFTLVYDVRNSRIYLRSSDGNSFLGGQMLGETGTLANEAGSLDLATSTVTAITNGVRLSLVVTPKAGLVGTKQVWTRVADTAANTQTGADAAFGFKTEGLLVVSDPNEAAPTESVSVGGVAAPKNTNVSAVTGTETNFHLALSDANGAAEIKEGWFLVNEVGNLEWTNGIALVYDARHNILYLRSSDGQSAVAGTPGATGTLQNDAVSINLANTTVSRAATTIDIVVAATVKAGYTGTKQIWSRVQDSAGNTQTGADANFGFNTEGTLTLTNPATAPRLDQALRRLFLKSFLSQTPANNETPASDNQKRGFCCLRGKMARRLKGKTGVLV